jgi:prepilin-type N-terminal cleavage/methylation domain-containing protein
MKYPRCRARGFTLLEVVVASGIMGVGTLAVFTFYLQLQAQPAVITERYEALQEAQAKRPQPLYIERWSGLSCELEGGK